MNATDQRSVSDGRIASRLLGVIILVVAGVAFFRRKRTLISTVPESSEEWEDCLGI